METSPQRPNEILFAIFAAEFANFAVKIFKRKERKGVVKFAKDTIHTSLVTVLCFTFSIKPARQLCPDTNIES
jgi:predicted 3-demethylubiquinone-9 3-methyltransferase (glyoxalase superfamily)